MIAVEKLDRVVDDSIRYVESKGYRSFDVFDALTNPLVDRTTRGRPLLRRIAIQLNAKSPVNFRGLGMKSLVHTKTLSDMLSAYSMMFKDSHDESYLFKAERMLDALLERRIQTPNGIGWGLNFPYTTRFVDAGIDTPNLYNTVNSLSSILDYYEVNPDKSLNSLVASVVSFIRKDLGIVYGRPDLAWISYYPNQKHPTYNVNALAAFSFVKANLLLKEESVDDLLIRALLNTIKEYQNKDGSWYYALSGKGRWVDGYHSGFILESLSFILHSFNDRYGLRAAVENGFEYYRHNLFTSDFAPCYFPKRQFPLESQNSAQAIQTVANCSRYLNLNETEWLSALITRVLDRLYDSCGYFYHKEDRWFRYKHIYFRWSQTPMIVALLFARRYFQN
jgi:hypothetical protein